MLTNGQFYGFLKLDNAKAAAMTTMKQIEDVTEKMQAIHAQQVRQSKVISGFIPAAVAFLLLSFCVLVYCPCPCYEYFLTRNHISISAQTT